MKKSKPPLKDKPARIHPKNAGNKFSKRLKGAETLADIFELVKDAVYNTLGQKRPGLMLGLAEIGSDRKKFVGGFHPLGSNFIIINKAPLRKVVEKNKKMYQPYVFHIMLREYIHSFGVMDEDVIAQTVKQISKALFGKEHIVTELSTKFTKFFPYVVYADPGEFSGQDSTGIEMVDNFDSSSASYLR